MAQYRKGAEIRRQPVKLPIDTSAIAFLCAMPPEPVVDFETRRPKDDENGEPLYVIQLLVMGEDSADLIAVKVPGVPSAGIRQGAPVKVSGLVAQRHIGGRQQDDQGQFEAVGPGRPEDGQQQPVGRAGLDIGGNDRRWGLHESAPAHRLPGVVTMRTHQGST